MKIGIPLEIKTAETRVACTPSGVRHLVAGGHRVVVQSGAGAKSGFTDDKYRRAGAMVSASADKVWRCDLLVKVKEPVEEEYQYFRKGLVLFTYLHLAGNPELARRLLEAEVTAIAYETVQENGRLPLLSPMSEIAGKMSVLMGGYFLSSRFGGEGRLLGGVPGVLPASVVVLGGGSAGMHAAKVAAGLGSSVTLLELEQERMRFLESALPAQVHTLYSTRQHIEEQLASADLVIGAVLVPGAAAPKLVLRSMLRSMKRGSVLVDIAIDQGGCFESSRPTTHEDPVFIEEGVLHYCVTNMPAAYPQTSTEALTGVTLPYIRRMADLGLESAMVMMPGLVAGLNTWQGRVVHPAIAESLSLQVHLNPFA
ncbi:MAG: alanine dehydrogenase [Pelodictyon luteolum]|uniref:Alanine dehydrogenase n=1 Tax=Pelodictyon luteolum TaxID=1100 RepID=A0A165LDB8_PELLU|nr:alanine dehydrogenase [Pelodictyon luteolum]KZK73881.1 MAG: alanine dehydrogenase [Pelodictyon luteolum]